MGLVPPDARRSKRHRLEIEYHTRLEKGRVEPADFDAFRKFHEEVSRAYRVWLTLKPARDLEDAPALEAILGLTPGDRQTAVILANLYLREDQPEDARRVVHRARYYSPDDVALAELAVKSAASAKEEERVYRELVRRFPGEFKYAVALGRTLIGAGKLVPARAILERIVKDGSGSQKAQAHYQIARGFLLDNKPVGALLHWKAAAEIDDDSVRTSAGLRLHGQIYERLGQAKEAIGAYREALSFGDADAEEALDALVRLSLATKEPAEALKYLRRYTVAVAGDPAGLAKAGDYYLALGRRDDAFDLAAESLKEQDSPQARRTLGLVRLHRGQYAAAAADLEKAHLDGLVLEGQVRCQLALGRLTRAMKLAEQADKVAGPAPGLLRVCAQALRLAQRRKVVTQGLRVPPDKADAWDAAIDRFVCAEQVYAEGRQADQVAALLDGVFADRVEIGAAYALRGLLLLDRGRLSAALADAERAVALAPKEPRGYYIRGRVLAGTR